jgi:acetylglutamate kinase
MVQEDLKKGVLEDIILLRYVGIKPVIVHGGGPEISSLAKRLGIEARFIAGQRVTDEDTMDVVEMVLAGRINGEIVSGLNHLGGRAVGLSGKDGRLITAEKAPCPETGHDLGYVGRVAELDVSMLKVLEDAGYIPVISPIGMDKEGQTLNINADFVAARMAAELKAAKFLLLTDVPGVLRDPEDINSLVSTIKVSQVEELISDGTIQGGMIPKVKACMEALTGGAEKAHIINGKIPHSLLLEIFTDKGIGTQIIKD